MFSLTGVILRLRALDNMFEDRVGGTQDFEAASGKEANGIGDNLPIPHCWAMPLYDEGEPPQGNGTSQRITERFATIVCVNNKTVGDLMPDDQIREARRQLIEAFFEWSPVAYSGDIRYVRGVHLDMNASRIWHQFEWEVSYYVNKTDDEGNLIDEPLCAVVKEVIFRIGRSYFDKMGNPVTDGAEIERLPVVPFDEWEKWAKETGHL